ncbi:hypothetical protein [Solimonas fluminis]|uniref:hypothetical protein n=1 Tax=Solimonas fluminis TaxID=2086571 RepID=UPI0013FD43C8|nr:hypothetical protein [Solimonas fluminis]
MMGSPHVPLSEYAAFRRAAAARARATEKRRRALERAGWSFATFTVGVVTGFLLHGVTP